MALFRPSDRDHEKRDKMLTLRMTEGELRALNARAELERTTVANLVRRVLSDFLRPKK